MNFQLPPNSVRASAIRSVNVWRSSSTSLRLRVTRWRSISSVCRRRSVMALSISSARFGLRRTYAWKCSRERTARRASSVTVAEAERDLPSSIAISPKKSPPASSASVTSSPSRSRMCIRTRPPSMRYMASPASPFRKRTLPAGLTSSTNSERRADASASSSDAKSGTERRASSVIRGRAASGFSGFSDMGDSPHAKNVRTAAKIITKRRASKPPSSGGACIPARLERVSANEKKRRHSSVECRRFFVFAASPLTAGGDARAPGLGLSLGGDFDVAVYYARERVLARRAHDALGLAPAVEEDERGDALDAVALRHALVLVNVELDELGLPLVALGQLLERGRERAAGRAPLGPEIQHHGHVRLQHLGLERRVGHLRNVLAHKILLLVNGSVSNCGAKSARVTVSPRPRARVSNFDYTRAEYLRRGRERAEPSAHPSGVRERFKRCLRELRTAPPSRTFFRTSTRRRCARSGA